MLEEISALEELYECFADHVVVVRPAQEDPGVVDVLQQLLAELHRHHVEGPQPLYIVFSKAVTRSFIRSYDKLFSDIIRQLRQLGYRTQAARECIPIQLLPEQAVQLLQREIEETCRELLQAEAKLKHKSSSSTEDKIRRLKRRLQQLEANYTRLKQEYDELHANYTRVYAAFTKAAEAAQMATLRAAQLEAELARLNPDLARLRQEKNLELRGENDKLRQQLAMLLDENNMLRAALDEKTLDYARLLQENQVLKKELEEISRAHQADVEQAIEIVLSDLKIPSLAIRRTT